MPQSITPGSDYDAALWGATVGVRRERRFFRVVGKSPGDMLNGLLSNSPPPPLVELDDGWMGGDVVYSALLTAKGRMITDLRIVRAVPEGFILELPHVGSEGALAHFRKFLPPRLAKLEDLSESLTLLTVLGPEAPMLLTRTLSRMDSACSLSGLGDLEEGEERLFPAFSGGVLRVTRNGEVHTQGWDLTLKTGAALEVRDRLDAEGAVPLTDPSLEVLRVEKGRPAFGRDMDDDTIPLEAGIQGRAIDNEKGCYTGQEVVIRIRDRGHVNKELRGLLLGDNPIPRRGTELFQAEREKSVGWVTSAVPSPALGQTIALGYLRRSVEVGGLVRVGDPQGPEVQVRALTDQGWVLD